MIWESYIYVQRLTWDLIDELHCHTQIRCWLSRQSTVWCQWWWVIGNAFSLNIVFAIKRKECDSPIIKMVEYSGTSFINGATLCFRDTSHFGQQIMCSYNWIPLWLDLMDNLWIQVLLASAKHCVCAHSNKRPRSQTLMPLTLWSYLRAVRKLGALIDLGQLQLSPGCHQEESISYPERLKAFCM